MYFFSFVNISTFKLSNSIPDFLIYSNNLTSNHDAFYYWFWDIGSCVISIRKKCIKKIDVSVFQFY